MIGVAQLSSTVSLVAALLWAWLLLVWILPVHVLSLLSQQHWQVSLPAAPVASPGLEPELLAAVAGCQQQQMLQLQLLPAWPHRRKTGYNKLHV